MVRKIKCAIIRGGTTKGIFIRGEDLPDNSRERDETIMRMFGSGDKWQIDGIGGGNQFASKVMIVWRSEDPNYDVKYMFGQVGVENRFIDWNGVDGNLTAAVGVYAYDEGLVRGVGDEIVEVNALNLNTKKNIMIRFNRKEYEERRKVTAETEWIEPCGSFLDRGCYPIGHGIDIINVENKAVQVSIIDAIALVVAINARDVGLTGYEMPGEENPEILALVEKIREKVGKSLGIVSPLFPLPIIFSLETRDYYTINGEFISRDAHDLSVRVISLGEIHHALSISGGIAMTVASFLPGNLLSNLKPRGENTVRFGHPRGIAEHKVRRDEKGGIKSVIVNREVRSLLEGWAFY
ncbi:MULTISPECIES: PrpF domain-containing protein [Sulfolobaceae]|uniref:PrpF protein n=1 Tax=Metallosphaera prunae TaxID=47304 RepID=A0A4D8RYA6_METPR|nr:MULTISPECIES: PrpF domain-containing protein [Sulfolobaceae]MCY0851101.1 hypothetical protein [Sulfuracidifex metallicus]QCO29120.1 hypothetical protein DFR88_00330 [Metallosphaera prunae]BBL47297.1 putative methylaconitate Delta-isomerase [Metallosphaera sedula]